MKAVAFGVLCGDHNQDGPRELPDLALSPTYRLLALIAEKRPLLGFNASSDSAIESVLLAYEPRFEEIKMGLEAMVRDRWGRDVLSKVKFHKMEYENRNRGPHDYDACHQMLSTILEDFLQQVQPSLILLHANAGTFVQQMHLYRYADRQLLRCPARLLVTAASQGGGVGHAIPRLGLSRKLSKPVVAEEEFTSAQEMILERFGRANASFEESVLPLMVRIGIFSDETILLTGATGTGKSFLAYLLHEAWTKRKKRQKTEKCFHVVNCGGMDPTFLYTEIFGAKVGAYTGAQRDRTGKMKLADKGTLFLDEIGDLDPRAQAMLLKAIEEKQFYPLGSDEPAQSGFRLICATNRNLRADVAAGKFREDLYARIGGWSFRLPSLAEREDHPKLIRDILDKWHAENKDKYQDRFRLGIGARPDAIAYLHEFLKSSAGYLRGNHRELQQVLARISTRSILNNEEEISKETVEAELLALKNAADEVECSYGDLFKRVIETALSQAECENMPPAYAVELWLIGEAERNHGNKAEAGRYLYDERNYPTQKIHDRREFLRKRSRNEEAP